MKASAKRWIAFGIVILALGGITWYVIRQVNLLYNYCYAISGAIIKKISLDVVKFTILLKIQNRSDITLNLGRQEYLIYINEIYVTKVTYTEPKKLVSKTSETFPINVEFNPKDLLKAGLQNIQNIIFDKSKLIIGIKGKINAKAGLVSVNDLTIEYNLSLAEMLEPSPENEQCKNFK